MGVMMKRRDLLTLVCAAMTGWSEAVAAQQNSMPVIGLLHPELLGTTTDFLDVFRSGLKDAGFVEGKNVLVEYRWAEGENARLPALAADLVRRRVAVIVALGSTPATLAAKRATSTIPIITFTGGDPVALGLAASLNRPGGNVTGATNQGTDLAPKRFELLHELMPDAVNVALLVNPTNPGLAGLTTKGAQNAARILGLKLQILSAGAEDEFEKAFTAVAAQPPRGLVIQVNSFFTARRKKLAEMALRDRIPAIYEYRDFAAAGGVMSLGGNVDGFRIAGLYTGRILKGESPAELPFQQVTQTQLVLSLKAAQALGIQVPASLIARADEVIE